MVKGTAQKKIKGASGSKESSAKFCIDCTVPAGHRILDPLDLERFLKERIKVDKKTSNLGSKIAVSHEQSLIYVNAEMPFSKRYLKYLTRKYLKKQQLRDFLRVLSSKANTYQLRYFDRSSVDDEDS